MREAEKNSVTAVAFLECCHGSFLATPKHYQHNSVTKWMVKQKGKDTWVCHKSLPCAECRREDSNLHSREGTSS
jgi:hypothetical protein